MSHFAASLPLGQRLLVDAAHAFQIAYVEGVLRPQITRVSSFLKCRQSSSSPSLFCALSQRLLVLDYT